jgi:hypothetical protein
MDLVGKADALDMKFRNTTNGYLLLREYVANDGHVYAEIWGKPSGTDVEMWSEPAHRDADGSDGSPTRQWKRRARSSSTESCTGTPTITWWAHTGTPYRRPTSRWHSSSPRAQDRRTAWRRGRGRTACPTQQRIQGPGGDLGGRRGCPGLARGPAGVVSPTRDDRRSGGAPPLDPHGEDSDGGRGGVGEPRHRPYNQVGGTAFSHPPRGPFFCRKSHPYSAPQDVGIIHGRTANSDGSYGT